MPLRLSATWMSIADDRILEYLESIGPRSPTKIAEDDRIPFSRAYVNRRCRKLEQAGLVQNIGNGVYMITNRGADYLAGEYDLRELVDPDEA